MVTVKLKVPVPPLEIVVPASPRTSETWVARRASWLTVMDVVLLAAPVVADAVSTDGSLTLAALAERGDRVPTRASVCASSWSASRRVLSVDSTDERLLRAVTRLCSVVIGCCWFDSSAAASCEMALETVPVRVVVLTDIR